MLSDPNVYSEKRAEACIADIEGLISLADALVKCHDTPVALDGIKQQCHDVDVLRGKIVTTARAMAKNDCGVWAKEIYNAYLMHWNDYRYGDG